MKTTTTQLVAHRSPTSRRVPRRATPYHIVAADHPSLDRDVEAFIHHLRSERTALLLALTERGGFRLAAIECGRVVGLARVDQHGELHIAVAIEHRGLGIATMLGCAALERAISLEYSRVSMCTTRPNRAARRIGEAMGCIVVENASGRTDMIAHLPTGLRIG